MNINIFREIEKERTQLIKLTQNLTPVIRILDYENYKADIQQILHRIDQATALFKVCKHSFVTDIPTESCSFVYSTVKPTDQYSNNSIADTG